MDLKLLSLTVKVFECEFEFEFSHYIYSHITEKFKEIQQVGFKTKQNKTKQATTKSQDFGAPAFLRGLFLAKYKPHRIEYKITAYPHCFGFHVCYWRRIANPLRTVAKLVRRQLCSRVFLLRPFHCMIIFVLFNVR